MGNPNLNVNELYEGHAPFDDNYLIYDKEYHRYVLNENAIMSVFGEDADRSELENLSNDIYCYIYSFKTYEHFDKMEFLLAHNPYFREALYLAMLEQYKYSKVSGGNNVHLEHGVDVNKDTGVTIEQLRNELRVGMYAILILNRYGLLISTFKDGLDFDYNYYRGDY